MALPNFIEIQRLCILAAFSISKESMYLMEIT